MMNALLYIPVMEKVTIIWYIIDMRGCFFSHRLFLLVLVFGFVAFPLISQEYNTEGQSGESQSYFKRISWYVNGSVLFFPEDNGMASDPMPVLPSLGAGASFPIKNVFRAELSWDLYFTHYGYDYSLDRAVPYAIENRSSLVFGSILSLHAAAYFNINSFMTVRVYGGPSADLRIVLIAEDLQSADMKEASKQTASVRNYFWSRGRWFMPVIGAGVDFAINSRFVLGVDLRIWVPIYRLWTGENLPPIEGWRFGPGIRFTIR